MEGYGSGSIPLTNGSGSRRPKNMWIRWIRIRISNTYLYVEHLDRWAFWRAPLSFAAAAEPALKSCLSPERPCDCWHPPWTMVNNNIGMKDNSYLCTYDLYGPVRNVFDTRRYITKASGRGLGPGNREFFWALWNGIEPISECHNAPVHNNY